MITGPLASFVLGLIIVSPSLIQAQTPRYIDTHVHLRDTATSPMLGNKRGGEMKRGSQMNRRPMRGERFQNRRGRQTGAGVQDGSATENLIVKMDQMGVEQALVVVVPGQGDLLSEYKKMRELVNKTPERIKLMAGGAMLSEMLQGIESSNVTAQDKQQFRQTAEQLLNDGAVGFGEMISYHLCMASHHSFQYASPDHPLFLLLADIAAEHGVPIDLHMEAVVKERQMPSNLSKACSKNPATLKPTIPALETLLKHNQKAKIVWQHIGWDNVGDMKVDLLRDLLGKHPNLYMALRIEKRETQVGQGGVMPNRIVGGSGKIEPKWLALIRDFSDRFVIGSDEFFFERVAERPNQSFTETWALLEQVPNAIAEKLGRTNASRIYNLH